MKVKLIALAALAVPFAVATAQADDVRSGDLLDGVVTVQMSETELSDVTGMSKRFCGYCGGWGGHSTKKNYANVMQLNHSGWSKFVAQANGSVIHQNN